MTYTTHCPHCLTRFKINKAQLTAANGFVRCGLCWHAFDAAKYFVSPAAPRPAAQQRETPDNSALSISTAAGGGEVVTPPPVAETLHQPDVSIPCGNTSPVGETAPEVFAHRHRSVSRTAVMPALKLEGTSTCAPQNERHRRASSLRCLSVVAALIGVLLLVGQLVFFSRAHIAAIVPALRPTLERLCGAVDCKVPWLADIAYLRTERSELVCLSSSPNLIQLSATLKNRAPYSQAYPMLEVTLKDSDDQVLIRKVFSPKEYLYPSDFQLGHLNSNGTVMVNMKLDTGKVQAIGYSLYWFYS